MSSWYPGDSDEAEAYHAINQMPTYEQLVQELLVLAASFVAAHQYEKHGKAANYAAASELLAGFIGTFIDMMVETKGSKYIDKGSVKRDARAQTEAKLIEMGEFPDE
ncbi:hypothetical protein FIBSPDRAFT_945678 [Athelia psychrophila]|uniref:Uncharacterized protein n=1 Tax=Athelia psychrophila TaxID=1759441 RepID=A0A166TLN8_9AGAM|nr:hypothetical protein FIBSPDRAFT_945678 [Fibularhizoctonia sp. CBS 109695]